jgi:hypothetical protein
VRSDDRTGIGAEESVPPWERPGCFRLDCEPHRGNLLQLLGAACLITGVLSFFPVGFLAPVGILLSLTTWGMIRRDLAKMRRGLMDPYGRGLTRGAWKLVSVGLLLSALAAAGWGSLFLLLGYEKILR